MLFEAIIMHCNDYAYTYAKPLTTMLLSTYYYYHRKA